MWAWVVNAFKSFVSQPAVRAALNQLVQAVLTYASNLIVSMIGSVTFSGKSTDYAM